MKPIWYSSSDEEDPERRRIMIADQEDPTRPLEQAAIAERCADLFDCEEGRGLHWPRDITLYLLEDGPPVASFHVERQAVFEFVAGRKPIAA